MASRVADTSRLYARVFNGQWQSVTIQGLLLSNLRLAIAVVSAWSALVPAQPLCHSPLLRDNRRSSDLPVPGRRNAEESGSSASRSRDHPSIRSPEPLPEPAPSRGRSSVQI